jgi:hypothetical protein
MRRAGPERDVVKKSRIGIGGVLGIFQKFPDRFSWKLLERGIRRGTGG